MDWYVQVELVGKLTDEQMADVAVGVTTMRYNAETGLAQLQYRVTAEDLAAATREGLAVLDGMTAVRQLIAAGVLTPPRAIEVKSQQAHAEKLPLLGTAEVAERLGISASRLRHLRAERVDFPRPVLELAGGALYDAADIDDFSSRWGRKPGRPPKAS